MQKALAKQLRLREKLDGELRMEGESQEPELGRCCSNTDQPSMRPGVHIVKTHMAVRLPWNNFNFRTLEALSVSFRSWSFRFN